MAPWRLCPGGGVPAMVAVGLLLALTGLGMLLLAPVQRLGGVGGSELRAYLDPGLGRPQALALSREIGGWPSVKSSRLLDRELAWREYSRHVGAPEGALPENPLPQVIIVVARDQASVPGLGARLSALGGVELLLGEPPWAERARNVGDTVFMLALLLIIAAVKVARDAMSIGALTRGGETGRMSLLGAGLWLGCGSGVVGCGLISLVTWRMDDAFIQDFAYSSLKVSDFAYLMLLSCLIGLVAASMPMARRAE